jgi:CelD/BcsL family acetyltransferase involved in cellulose biosynthesis
MSIRIEAGRISSVAALEPDWRALEARAPQASFFQGWTWMGCLAEERFPNPVLVRAEVDGVLAGLALFNRRRGRLFLSESGDARLDAPFIEHNAPLIAADAPAGLLPAMLRAAWRCGVSWGMRLSGVSPETAAAAGGVSWRRQDRLAPYVDLNAVRVAGGDYLRTLSANTRQQIRRSLRAFGERGEVRLDRADTSQDALGWFAALAHLHGVTWRQRGKPGAFAEAFVLRFHETLIAGGVAHGDVDILRASAGGAAFGYLYNLRAGRTVHAYQGGWDLGDAGQAERPGMVCHLLAIERALAAGDGRYDFLAGEARYKTSLARTQGRLVWETRFGGWFTNPTHVTPLREDDAAA